MDAIDEVFGGNRLAFAMCMSRFVPITVILGDIARHDLAILRNAVVRHLSSRVRNLRK